MVYQFFFRRLLLLLPVLILVLALGYLGKGFWMHDANLRALGLDGLIIFAPSCAVIFWGMVYELDDSKRIMALLRNRAKGAKH